MKDPMTARKGSFCEEIFRIFENLRLQKPYIFYYDKTDSTNTRARAFAEGGENVGCAPAIFFSRAQSAGRGTRGRSFESPEGGGAYVSLLFYPDRLPKGVGITAYAAVAAARAIDSASANSIKTKIKWVNDLVVDDKKLGGILSECKLNGVGCDYAIVGIGINTRPAPHSDEVRGVMTSLSELGVDLTPEEVAVAVVREFFSSLPEAGEAVVADEYRSRSSLIGRPVRIIRPEGTTNATAVGIADDGSIILSDECGRELIYNSGDVSVRPNE